MILYKLLLILIFIVFIGCNQTDSSTESQSTEANKLQSQAKDSDISENENSEINEDSKGKILALVNGSHIYEDDLNSGNLEFAITDEILYQVGIKQGKDKQYKDKVKEYEKMIIVRAIKVELLENAEPTKDISEEEIQYYYDSNKDKYTNFRIHEISFSDAFLGQEIKEKAESGIDPIDIANSYPDKEVMVVDVGYNREMAQKFPNKDVGSVSDVIRKPNGAFSVLKIIEKKEIPINASRKSIRHLLEAKKQAQLIHDYSQKMAEENDIEVEIVN